MFIAIALAGSLIVSIIGIVSINQTSQKITTDYAKIREAQVDLIKAQTAKIQHETAQKRDSGK